MLIISEINLKDQCYYSNQNHPKPLNIILIALISMATDPVQTFNNYINKKVNKILAEKEKEKEDAKDEVA